MLILVEKREGERGEVWHLGGGCGLPETREEQCRPLPPQAQLDVPSCLPQIPKEEKVEAESKEMESERAVERTERNIQIIKQRMSRIEEEQTSKKGGADNEPMTDRGKVTDQTDRMKEKDAIRYQGENSEKRLKSSSKSAAVAPIPPHQHY